MSQFCWYDLKIGKFVPSSIRAAILEAYSA